ncbi:protein of unknown function [Aminobacter niigataensis]|nr:protein of unknown function [Aminobacter niigataensis]
MPGRGKQAAECEGAETGNVRGEAMFRTPIGLALWAATFAMSSAAIADEAQVARGEYLVTMGGCTDCHTPGYLLANPMIRSFSAARMSVLRFRVWVSSLAATSRQTRRRASATGRPSRSSPRSRPAKGRTGGNWLRSCPGVPWPNSPPKMWARLRPFSRA